MGITDGIVYAVGTYAPIHPWDPITNRLIWFSVYDPGRKKWISHSIKPGIDPGNLNLLLAVNSGVVVSFDYRYLWRHSDILSKAVFSTYDPGLGNWQHYETSSQYPPDPVVLNNGIVAFKSWPTQLNLLAYDPRDANWHNYQATISDSQVWIEDDGTVKCQDGRQWGYKPHQGGWTEGGSTLPLSLFVAQPNNGPPPLQVWLTDMSIGGTSVRWDLGDGSTSPDRSLRHTFTQPGKLSVNQRVTSPLDESLASCDINVWDVTPPAGSILINGGATLTNSIAVTLNVSVSGADSGSTMRFANGDATGPRSEWSAWEPLAATKAWSLTRQDGEAQVWAQFKDASSNYSSPTSDAITLDATPPAGSITINAGAQYANTTAVTLNLWADDGTGSGVKAMMVCNMVKNTEGNWIIPDDFLFTPFPYAARTGWNLSAGTAPSEWRRFSWMPRATSRPCTPRISLWTAPSPAGTASASTAGRSIPGPPATPSQCSPPER